MSMRFRSKTTLWIIVFTVCVALWRTFHDTPGETQWVEIAGFTISQWWDIVIAPLAGAAFLSLMSLRRCRYDAVFRGAVAASTFMGFLAVMCVVLLLYAGSFTLAPLAWIAVTAGVVGSIIFALVAWSSTENLHSGSVYGVAITIGIASAVGLVWGIAYGMGMAFLAGAIILIMQSVLHPFAHKHKQGPP